MSAHEIVIQRRLMPCLASEAWFSSLDRTDAAIVRRVIRLGRQDRGE